MPNAELVHLAGVLLSAFTLIAGAIWWLLKRHFNKIQRENRTLKDRNAKLRERIVELEKQVQERAAAIGMWQADRTELKAKQAGLENQLLDAKEEIASYCRTLNRTKEQAGQLEQQLHDRAESHQKDVEAREEQIRQLRCECEHESTRATQAEASCCLLTAQIEKLNNQLDEVVKQDERVWERPVTGPSFLPLSRRDVPIIAVLNLKGGVGKTTITANLAGLMAQQEKKVLVIDADYQRNLSMLLMSDKDRKMLHLERKTLQHFLRGDSHNPKSLLYATSEVAGLPNYRIVTNSDALNASPANGAFTLEDIGLEDVEMRMMARWMFSQSGCDDVRLCLRKALHDLALKENGYRYVLIDCPPRLSTACINALAACDFFLIPVLLDATSARSVPNLLRTLRRLSAPMIFPHLKCLGIVANQVTLRLGQLIARQATTWKDIRVISRVGWGSDVHLFTTMIPDSGYIAQAAGRAFGQGDGSSLAIDTEAIRAVFDSLLEEINTRIDHESKHLAAVST